MDLLTVVLLDGALRAAERESAWRAITHQGVALEWCVARSSMKIEPVIATEEAIVAAVARYYLGSG